MSSSAGPSRVSRPRRSSEATSNGSTASSTGTDDGARTAVSGEVLMSGDGGVMAPYLGFPVRIRKGEFVLGNADLLPSPLVGEGAFAQRRRMRGLYPRRQTPHPSPHFVRRHPKSELRSSRLPQGERGSQRYFPPSFAAGGSAFFFESSA